MTRDDILRDERLKRYSLGTATPEEVADLRALAETEPLYAEALATFAPWTEGENRFFLKNIALLRQIIDMRAAVRALLREVTGCALCDGLATHASTLGLGYCDKHTAERRVKGRDVEPLPHAEKLRKVLALLEDDESEKPACADCRCAAVDHDAEGVCANAATCKCWGYVSVSDGMPASKP